MTNGEKMIWAAVFAQTYQEIYNPPFFQVKPKTKNFEEIRKEKKKKWKEEKINEAIKDACRAVELLNNIEDKDQFDGFDYYETLQEMLND